MDIPLDIAQEGFHSNLRLEAKNVFQLEDKSNEQEAA